MNKEKIKWVKIEIVNFSANPIPNGYPFKELMKKGKVFPTSKSQAREFVQMGYMLASLNNEDVRVVEWLLNKYGFKGNYEYTKSNRVRLINHFDLDKALKLEYGL